MTSQKMLPFKRILRCISIILLITIFSACAPSKKNYYSDKRLKASQTHASQLGRNKYYFSGNYQKKLEKSYKRK